MGDDCPPGCCSPVSRTPDLVISRGKAQERDGGRAQAQRWRNKQVMDKLNQGQGASETIHKTDPGSEPPRLVLLSVMPGRQRATVTFPELGENTF